MTGGSWNVPVLREHPLQTNTSVLSTVLAAMIQLGDVNKQTPSSTDLPYRRKGSTHSGR